MTNQEDKQNKEEQKKTVFKEKHDPVNEKKQDNGETSSIAGLGRADLGRPERKHKPLGSSHEPGTTPGSDI